MNAELSERQKEIIKASLELISENGIQALTIKNLSKKIGLVESAIYRHFESKTQILVSILNSIEMQAMPSELPKNIGVIPLIEQNIRKRFETFAANPALVSVVFAEELFQNEVTLVNKTKEKIKQGKANMIALIEKGQQEGEIRKDIDSEYFAILITGTIRMFVKHWKMSDYSFDLIQKGNELLETLKLVLKPV